MKTHYDVLGVDPSAGEQECRGAYHLRAQLLHPDVHAGASPEVIAAAEVAMQELNAAWAVVGNPEARAAYNWELANGARADAGREPQSNQWPTGQEGPRSPAPQECRLCGSHPAVQVTFRCEVGQVFTRTRTTAAGPLCRDCAVSLFRYLTNRTLLLGWWGIISFFQNWATILENLTARWGLRRLWPPAPTPGVVAVLSRPLDVGRPLWKRSGMWCVLVVGGALLAVGVVTNHPKTATAQGPSTPSLTELTAALNSAVDAYSNLPSSAVSPDGWRTLVAKEESGIAKVKSSFDGWSARLQQEGDATSLGLPAGATLADVDAYRASLGTYISDQIELVEGVRSCFEASSYDFAAAQPCLRRLDETNRTRWQADGAKMQAAGRKLGLI